MRELSLHLRRCSKDLRHAAIVARLRSRTGNASWDPIVGYVSYEECYQSAQRMHDKEVAKDSSNVYTCLSDTVDPRGAKGK